MPARSRQLVNCNGQVADPFSGRTMGGIGRALRLASPTSIRPGFNEDVTTALRKTLPSRRYLRRRQRREFVRILLRLECYWTKWTAVDRSRAAVRRGRQASRQRFFYRRPIQSYPHLLWCNQPIYRSSPIFSRFSTIAINPVKIACYEFSLDWHILCSERYRDRIAPANRRSIAWARYWKNGMGR